jgi:hypothetical protein
LNAIDELAGHTSSGFAHWGYVLAAFCALLLASGWATARGGANPAAGAHRRAGRNGAVGLAVAAVGRIAPAQLAETLRDLGWLGLVYALFASDGRNGHMGLCAR